MNKEARKKYLDHKKEKLLILLNYIFSDESFYRIMGIISGPTYYKIKNSEPNTKSFIRTKKFGESGIMIFGFITYGGDFKIYRCPKK